MRSTTCIKTAATAAREHNSEPRILEVLTVCQIGYLVPNLRFKRIRGGSGSCNDESIHYLVAQQQLNRPLPEQQGVAMEDETD